MHRSKRRKLALSGENTDTGATGEPSSQIHRFFLLSVIKVNNEILSKFQEIRRLRELCIIVITAIRIYQASSVSNVQNVLISTFVWSASPLGQRLPLTNAIIPIESL